MAGNQVWSPELWAPGPGVVLGQRLDTLHQRIYRSFQEAYCKGDGTETDMPGHINSSRRVMCIPEHGCDNTLEHLYPTFLENLALRLDRAAGLNGKRRVRPLELLTSLMPPDLRSCSKLEPYIVPDTDPRVGLRGEKGVRVRATGTRGLAAGDFVAVYRGHAMLGNSQFDRFKARQCKAVAVSAAVDREVLYYTHDVNLESYAAGSTDNIAMAKFAQDHGISLPPTLSLEPNDLLLISAYGVGNIGCLINDPGLDPLGTSNAESPLKDNVCMCEVHIGAWPFLVMFASRDIPPGEELRYAYGTEFWSNVRGRVTLLNGMLALRSNDGENAELGGGGEDAQALQMPETEAAAPLEEETEVHVPETEVADGSEEDGESSDDEGISPALQHLRPSQEGGAAGPTPGFASLGTVAGVSPSPGRRRAFSRKTPRGAAQAAEAQAVQTEGNERMGGPRRLEMGETGTQNGGFLACAAAEVGAQVAGTVPPATASAQVSNAGSGSDDDGESEDDSEMEEAAGEDGSEQPQRRRRDLSRMQALLEAEKQEDSDSAGDWPSRPAGKTRAKPGTAVAAATAGRARPVSEGLPPRTVLVAKVLTFSDMKKEVSLSRRAIRQSPVLQAVLPADVDKAVLPFIDHTGEKWSFPIFVRSTGFVILGRTIKYMKQYKLTPGDTLAISRTLEKRKFVIEFNTPEALEQAAKQSVRSPEVHGHLQAQPGIDPGGGDEGADDTNEIRDDDSEMYETADEDAEEGEAREEAGGSGAVDAVEPAGRAEISGSSNLPNRAATASQPVGVAVGSETPSTQGATAAAAAAAATPDPQQAAATAAAQLRRAEREATMFKCKLERCEKAVADLEDQVQEAQREAQQPVLPLLDHAPPVPPGQQPTCWRRAQIFCVFVGDLMKGPYDTGHLGELKDGGLNVSSEVFLDPSAPQRAPEACEAALRVLGQSAGGTWTLSEVLSMAFMDQSQSVGQSPPPSAQQQPLASELLEELADAKEELTKARQVYARKQAVVATARTALAEAEAQLPPGVRSMEAELEKARQRALGKRPAVEAPVKEWKPPEKVLKLGPDGAGTSAAHAALAEAEAAAAAAEKQPRSSDEVDDDVVDLTLLDD